MHDDIAIRPPLSIQSDGESQAEEDTPLDFYAEMRVHARHALTGVEVELGYEHEGTWMPIQFGEGPSLFWIRHQLEIWLTHPDTLITFNGALDIEFSRQCVAETIDRCLAFARQVIEGTRPVPSQPIEVWPVNDRVWRVEPGHCLPPNITHLRSDGMVWQEVASLFPSRA